MKNKIALILSTLLITSSILTGCYVPGVSGQAAPQAENASQDASDGKREIRDGIGPETVLPTPTEDLKENPDDQENFDSYVWSADKLKENLENVVILDARSADDYKKEHIKGAVNATWQEWSNVDVPQDSGDWSLIDPEEEFAEELAALGIDGTKPIIVYNDPLVGWGEEGRQVWSLRYYGITDSYILNGGIGAAKEAGIEVTKEPTEITPTDKPALSIDESYYATTDYVSEHLDDNILDVRADTEFAALTNSGEKTNGRIPGCSHVWYKDFYHTDGTLLTPAEIRARVEPLGYETNEPIIAYCTGGIRSGFSTIVLRIAGYKDARNYDASFSGWAGLDKDLDAEVYEDLTVVNN